MSTLKSHNYIMAKQRHLQRKIAKFKLWLILNKHVNACSDFIILVIVDTELQSLRTESS